jgi:RHS repeat-associated protein
MIMPNRSYSASSGYRFGFDGKENDNEVKGEGNQQDYGMRIYDPRVGRFLSVDPISKKYPELTPYQFASNSPIANVDIDGLERGSSISAGVTNGVNRYSNEKTQQANGVTKYFTSWEPYRNAWNYIKDVGKTATGDVAAIQRVTETTTKTATNFSFSLANSLAEPAFFISTMNERTLEENVEGLTYYSLKGIELGIIIKTPEVFEEAGSRGGSLSNSPTSIVRDENNVSAATKGLPNPYPRFYRFETKYGQHSKTFGTSGTMSRAAYYNRALKLANAEIGGDVLGFTSEENTTFKLNKRTGEFVVINPEGKISSFYRRASDPIKYFEEQKQKYGVKKAK